MKLTKLALSILVGVGAGCTAVAPVVSLSELPNCFDANYDRERSLFTILGAAGNAVNQQCLLSVGASGAPASASRLAAGSYRVYLADGGGGGAGGTMQAFHGGGGGGGGGGGAGAKEVQATVVLTEGTYKLTIGAGGQGGNACAMSIANPGGPDGFGGGPGWFGGPSSMVHVASGALLIGTPGADAYVRPTRGQNEKTAGKMDAHGGSGPGQASGGHGERPETKDAFEDKAQSGAGARTSSRPQMGGTTGSDSIGDKRSGVGGGGGATSIGQGGGGGGESPGRAEIPPVRGTLGSGGGGGEGSTSECDAGAAGGHGYIALRRN